MDHIKEAYGRMNLRQLRGFLLYGSDDYGEDVTPYLETLQKRSDPIQRRLESIYPDGPELDNATGELNDALVAYEYVYMELGIKAGARLLYQLLIADDSHSELLATH